jgi:hypothetical protein
VLDNDRVRIDAEIAEMMREVVNIQRHMRPIVLEVYGRFLVYSSNIEEREYSDPKQEIEFSLIHQNYISQKDIDICLDYDLAPLGTDPHFLAIQALHQCFHETYAEPVGE